MLTQPVMAEENRYISATIVKLWEKMLCNISYV